MKGLIILIATLTVASAKSIDIDIDSSQAGSLEKIAIGWSQVRPFEDTDQYWSRIPKEFQYLREQRPGGRIVNGLEATPGQFPYQVYLEYQRDGQTFICGGSILSNFYILTTASCVHRATGGIAIVGAHNRDITEPSQQRIPFSLVYYHAEYNPNTFLNNVAVVRLISPISYNVRVQAVRLPPRNDNRPFAGLIGTVSGFGRTCDTCSSSNVLRFTTNTIVSHADCLAAWGNSHMIQPSNICLSTSGQTAICNGDLGSPLTVMDGGSPMQVGIASHWQGGSCISPQPSAFVRVTSFLDWIMHVIAL